MKETFLRLLSFVKENALISGLFLTLFPLGYLIGSSIVKMETDDRSINIYLFFLFLGIIFLWLIILLVFAGDKQSKELERKIAESEETLKKNRETMKK